MCEKIKIGSGRGGRVMQHLGCTVAAAARARARVEQQAANGKSADKRSERAHRYADRMEDSVNRVNDARPITIFEHYESKLLIITCNGTRE